MVGVLLEVLVVEGAEVVGVFGLVLLVVCLVNPAEGVHEPGRVVSQIYLSLDIMDLHLVQRRCHISHHGH